MPAGHVLHADWPPTLNSGGRHTVVPALLSVDGHAEPAAQGVHAIEPATA